MQRSFKPCFDIATGIDTGAREYQEDCLVADFPVGETCGIGVLADGMGAHVSGDLASAIVVGQVFAALKMRRSALKSQSTNIPAVLKKAVGEANMAMSSFVEKHPDCKGMGATLVATVVVDGQLYWLSIGDSPLYLIRNGTLKRLNEDHSMAPQIDAMVASGQLSAEVAATHPDRNCLTSAILGQEIPRIDCPDSGLTLEHGDIVIVASDGLQTLSDAEINGIAQRTNSSADVAQSLLTEVAAADEPEQDNTSMLVVTIDKSPQPVAAAAPKPAKTTTKPSATDDVLLAALVSDLEEAPDLINQDMAL